MEMDSPENDLTSEDTTVAVTSAAAPSDSVSVSDSSIFSYINNLSPIKPVKAAPVVPDFQGLSSPPIVFTSPHLNPLRESNCLKSSRCPQLSPTELFQKGDGNKKNETISDELGKSQSQSSSVSVPCVDKDCDNRGPLEDQDASLSGRIDEYLADGVDVDSGSSAHSASLSLVQSIDMPQSVNDSTDLKEIDENFNKNDTRQDAEQVVNTFPGTLELSGPEFHGKSLIENRPAETDAKQGGSERPSSVCQKIKSGFSVDHASEEQHCELPVAQHAGASRRDKLDCGSAFLSESVQPIQGYEDCNKTTREMSNESSRNMVLHDPMGQHHRAMHRRCLRFEEVEQIVIENTPSWSSSNVVTNSRLPDSPADLEFSESSCLEISTTSSCRQLGHLAQPIISMISPRNSGNSRSEVSKRSGIGLHLNSVVNATLACGASGNMKSVDKAYLNEQGRKMVSVSIMGGDRPENKRNSSTLSNVRQNLLTSSKDGSRETQFSTVTSSLASWPPQILKSSNDPAVLEQSGYQTTPCDELKSISGHAHAVEELNHLSPNKKRKKALVTNDGDGCKRCNCKKSKCLKLYCDCFAAGIYCAEPCACQGCFNRPEYEDTVLETRQQIESRNPLAFAPKVVELLINSPAASNEEDGNNSTPSSARHKRGCNCKKSMCLKKYCECYQSNVGCSNGCRCEGCKNVFGKKEEYVAPKELIAKLSVKERFESRSDENLEMVESRDGLLQTEMCNKHNLTPLTPSFQFSNHGKDASKAQFSTRRCLPSPESNHNLPKSPESPGTSDNLDMLLQDEKDVEGIDQELNCSNIERMDHELSTAYGGYANVCAPSRLPNPPSTAWAYLMSSEISGCTTVSRAQLCPGSGHLSSVSSLHWRISPMTPAQFGGDKLTQAVDSDDKLHSQLEDDTPEILKNASSPNNAVKVSSPNKKRVAPPRNCLSDLRSGSSSGLRSGRKFILQAVPSFPPLTPCMDSKGSSSGHNVNDPQDFNEK